MRPPAVVPAVWVVPRRTVAVSTQVRRVGLAPSTIARLSLISNEHLDALASGDVTAALLVDYMVFVLTWWRAAALMGTHTEGMDVQLTLANRLLDRFEADGTVKMDATEYQLGRCGVMLMDRLAELVDVRTANLASGWSGRKEGLLLQRLALVGVAHGS